MTGRREVIHAEFEEGSRLNIRNDANPATTAVQSLAGKKRKAKQRGGPHKLGRAAGAQGVGGALGELQQFSDLRYLSSSATSAGASVQRQLDSLTHGLQESLVAEQV